MGEYRYTVSFAGDILRRHAQHRGVNLLTRHPGYDQVFQD